MHDLVSEQPASHVRTWLAVERSFRWSPSRLDAWKLEHLRRIVEHAHGRVPYYARRGPAPRFDSVQDFAAAVPAIDSSTLRTVALDDRLAAGIPDGTQRFTTSGSSGQSAPVLYPPTLRRLLGGLKTRMTLHRRINPAWRWSTVTASGTTPGVLAGRRRMPLQASDPAESHAAALQVFRPVVISGYPNLLVEVAEHLSVPLDLRAATTFGEQLTTSARDAIRSGFGCEVFDTYGANEVGAIGWQCRAADLYHLNHESVHVEIVDDDGIPVPDGTTGHVVVTDLANGLFPHLRYRLGDMARLSTRPCACGNELPALASVSGRQLDWLVTVEGDRIAPERLWMDLLVPIDQMTSVRRYRVRQATDRSVHIAIVAHEGAHLDESFMADVRRAYERVLGPAVPVSVAEVDRLDALPSGKYPMIVSDVDDATADRT